MNAYQRKYLILRSATADAVFSLRRIIVKLMIAQREAENVSLPKDQAKRQALDAAAEQLREELERLASEEDP